MQRVEEPVQDVAQGSSLAENRFLGSQVRERAPLRL